NAAQQLADQLESPVVASSEFVASSDDMLPLSIADEGMGEWRLFVPESFGYEPVRRRVALRVNGRRSGHTGTSSITDLWRHQPGSIEHLDIGGSPAGLTGKNIGAINAIERAVAPGGQVKVRALPPPEAAIIANAL